MMTQLDGTPVFYDWIYRDGDVYVDTGYKIPDDGVIYVSSIWGAEGSNREILGINDGNYSTYIRQRSASGSSQIAGAYAGSVEGHRNFGRYYSPSVEFNIFLTPEGCGDYESLEFSLTSGGHYPDSTLCIFSIPGWGGTKWAKKIGAIYVYGAEAKDITAASQLENYTPVASFIPCKCGSKVSYWHVEQDRLCDTVGSGKFIPVNRN